jgi:predicted RNA-binding protein with TRAM domain
MYGRDRRGFGRDRGDRGGRGFGGGGGFRGGFSSPKPIKIGEEYDVTVTDIGAKGDGITKVNNFVVFVINGKKGEKCRIRIKEVANKFAIAEKIGEAKEAEEEVEEREIEGEEEASEEETLGEDTEEASEEEESADEGTEE